LGKNDTFAAQFRDWSDDLDAFLSMRGIHQDLAANQAKKPTIAQAVIATAVSGRGPNGTPYPGYSESYKRQLGLVQKTGGGKSYAWSRKAASGYLATGKGGKRRVHRAAAAGQKRWLRGIESTGNKGGMLGVERFQIRVSPGGKAFLVWTAENPNMGVYAHVHNDGLPIGRNGPRKQREWMHLQSTLTATAVVAAYKRVVKARAAKFNSKQRNTK